MSMSEIKTGDRVKYKAGRGGKAESEGRVVNLALGMATIETANGKLINRRVSGLVKIELG